MNIKAIASFAIIGTALLAVGYDHHEYSLSAAYKAQLIAALNSNAGAPQITAARQAVSTTKDRSTQILLEQLGTTRDYVATVCAKEDAEFHAVTANYKAAHAKSSADEVAGRTYLRGTDERAYEDAFIALELAYEKVSKCDRSIESTEDTIRPRFKDLNSIAGYLLSRKKCN
jgi:hypothetical protein